MREEKKHETDGVKLSALEEDILTLMGTHKMYGLEMLDGLNDKRPIPIGFGSLYPTLNRLEKKGLVSWEWGSEQDTSGGARRKYYKVTGQGAVELKKVQKYRELLARRAEQGSLAPQGA